MIRTASAQRPPRRALRRAIAALIVAGLAIVGVAVYRSASAATLVPTLPVEHDAIAADGAVTADDGLLPDGVTAFDDAHPGVARLAPQLLEALRRAAQDAARDGVVIHVNSGWRSPEYQDRLLSEAVSQYGSEAEAARWVASAATSAHVSGDAVDIGSFDAVAWMSEHGAGYGLCRIYGNESWHFELRPASIDRGCPPTYADPTQDPRTRG